MNKIFAFCNNNIVDCFHWYMNLDWLDKLGIGFAVLFAVFLILRIVHYVLTMAD